VGVSGVHPVMKLGVRDLSVLILQVTALFWCLFGWVVNFIGPFVY